MLVKGFMDLPDNQFGVLTYKTPMFPISNDTWFIVLLIDQSASMSLCSSDGTMRMMAAKLTAINILRWMADNHTKYNTKVFVVIAGFDDKINAITPDAVQITADNVDNLCHVLETRLHPRGSTNFEIALNHAYDSIDSMHTLHPEYEYASLLLTDGQITIGCSNTDILSKSLHSYSSNYMIGFGQSHSATTLNALTKPMVAESGEITNNNYYRFVNEIEHAADVYSDILYEMFYSVVKRPTIKVTDGTIYDVEDREWKSELAIGSLSSEKTYTFYVSSAYPRHIECMLTGDTTLVKDENGVIDIVETIPDLHPLSFSQMESETGGLIFESCQMQKGENDLEENGIIITMYIDGTKHYLTYKTMDILSMIKNRTDEQQNDSEFSLTIKTLIHELFPVVKSYRKSLTDNNQILSIRTLEDDLYIAYKTIDLPIATMFCAARNTTQVRQCSYNPSDFSNQDDTTTTPCGPTRMTSSYLPALPVNRTKPLDNLRHLRPNRAVAFATTNDELDDDDTTNEFTLNIQTHDDMSWVNDHQMLDSTNGVVRTPTLDRVFRNISGK